MMELSSRRTMLASPSNIGNCLRPYSLITMSELSKYREFLKCLEKKNYFTKTLVAFTCFMWSWAFFHVLRIICIVFLVNSLFVYMLPTEFWVSFLLIKVSRLDPCDRFEPCFPYTHTPRLCIGLTLYIKEVLIFM